MPLSCGENVSYSVKLTFLLATDTTYISQLSKHQARVCQHAAAHILSKEPAMKHVMPQFDLLVQMLESINLSRSPAHMQHGGECHACVR